MTGTFGLGNLLRHHPAFRGAFENQPDIGLARQPQRVEDVAGAIDGERQRQLAAYHRHDRLEVETAQHVVPAGLAASNAARLAS
jgi:hypothetical protein